MIGCDIKPYASASHVQHEPRRTRRLLMHRKEIDRIEVKLQERILNAYSSFVLEKQKN